MTERLSFKGSFRAFDASGAPYLIDVFEWIQTSPHGSVVGLPLFRTPDGQSVMRIAKGEYEIAGTRTAVRSVDANCP